MWRKDALSSSPPRHDGPTAGDPSRILAAQREGNPVNG
jgi:hypothetical protein